MFLHLPSNGYHSPVPLAQPASVVTALVDTFRKRAKRPISVKEYRKII